MEHNYFDTFIAVAEDCPAAESKVPQPRGKSKTVAQYQYEMLSQAFAYTQEEVLFDVWLARQGDAGKLAVESLATDEIDALREAFFAKGQPCLRASPLTKTHGWGVIFDADGKAALCAVESDEYQAHLGDPDLRVLNAMRSKRA